MDYARRLRAETGDSCRCGCGHLQEDDLDHYARCSRLWRPTFNIWQGPYPGAMLGIVPPGGDCKLAMQAFDVAFNKYHSLRHMSWVAESAQHTKASQTYIDDEVRALLCTHITQSARQHIANTVVRRS